MKNRPNIQKNEIDIRALRHALSGALADFRLAHEVLLEDGDRAEARIVFDAGEKKLEKCLALLTVKI